MIYYFRESLKPFIKVEMEQQDRESMNFEEMVQRAVNTEAKAGLKSSTIIRDSDIRCPRGHCFSNSTASKIQTQRTATKDSPRFEESKAKETKSVYTDIAEPSKQLGKKDKKNKKRKFQEYRHNHTKEQKDQTPTTSINVTNTGSKKKHPNIICYNCDKKGQYSKSYPKPLKN